MNFVQRQKKPMVINKPASGRADMHKHKIMAVPILQADKVAGLLAFYKPIDDARAVCIHDAALGNGCGGESLERVPQR